MRHRTRENGEYPSDLDLAAELESCGPRALHRRRDDLGEICAHCPTFSR